MDDGRGSAEDGVGHLLAVDGVQEGSPEAYVPDDGRLGTTASTLSMKSTTTSSTHPLFDSILSCSHLTFPAPIASRTCLSRLLSVPAPVLTSMKTT